MPKTAIPLKEAFGASYVQGRVVSLDTEGRRVRLESCTVLYCTVLYCTVLYRTVLYCTVLYCAVLYCTVLYCTVLYCTVLYCRYGVAGWLGDLPPLNRGRQQHGCGSYVSGGDLVS